MKEKNCKYRLPCGWCDRKNEMCIYKKETIARTIYKITNGEYERANDINSILSASGRK